MDMVYAAVLDVELHLVIAEKSRWALSLSLLPEKERRRWRRVPVTWLRSAFSSKNKLGKERLIMEQKGLWLFGLLP